MKVGEMQEFLDKLPKDSVIRIFKIIDSETKQEIHIKALDGIVNLEDRKFKAEVHINGI